MKDRVKVNNVKDIPDGWHYCSDCGYAYHPNKLAHLCPPPAFVYVTKSEMPKPNLFDNAKHIKKIDK